MQAEAEYRDEPDDIGSFFVRNTEGDMVPMTTLVRVDDFGTAFTSRFNSIARQR